MEERRRCTTVRQLELMIELLEGHRDLALGRVKSKEARAASARLWREFAEILNAEGPARTGKEWAKVWNDYKCRVRAKLVNINASQRSTGGGPSNVPDLTALEERVANILGRDIGPLPNVRHDHFASNVDAEVVEEQENAQLLSNAGSEIMLSDIQQEALPGISQPQQLLPQPASPVPSITGATPSTQNSPRSTAGRVRHVRARRRIELTPHVLPAPAPTQSARSALEESKLMVLRIEKLRAEAALANAQANNSYAESFKLIAESIDRFSQKFCQAPTE